MIRRAELRAGGEYEWTRGNDGYCKPSPGQALHQPVAARAVPPECDGLIDGGPGPASAAWKSGSSSNAHFLVLDMVLFMF